MFGKQVLCRLVLATILELLVTNNSFAKDYVVTLSRGQATGQFLLAGDTLTVYYNPDGTYPSIQAWQAAGGYYLPAVGAGSVNNTAGAGSNTPFIGLNSYVYGSRVGWQAIYGQLYVPGAPWTTGFQLTGVKGTQYKFFFNCYQGGNVVYVTIK